MRLSKGLDLESLDRGQALGLGSVT